MAAKHRLFIVHGYLAGPHFHWFNSVKTQAEALGMEVIVPAMPTPTKPELNAWLKTLEQAVGQVDAHTYFVGHSLGGLTLLQYLSQQKVTTCVAGAILVASFDEPVHTLPQLDAFSALALDHSKLQKTIPRCAVITSLNDQIVAPEYSLRLSQRLNATLHGLPNAGHFLESDGFSELPLIAEFLEAFIADVEASA